MTQAALIPLRRFLPRELWRSSLKAIIHGLLASLGLGVLELQSLLCFGHRSKPTGLRKSGSYDQVVANAFKLGGIIVSLSLACLAEVLTQKLLVLLVFLFNHFHINFTASLHFPPQNFSLSVA